MRCINTRTRTREATGVFRVAIAPASPTFEGENFLYYYLMWKKPMPILNTFENVHLKCTAVSPSLLFLNMPLRGMGSSSIRGPVFTPLLQPTR